MTLDDDRFDRLTASAMALLCDNYQFIAPGRAKDAVAKTIELIHELRVDGGAVERFRQRNP